MVTGTFPPQCRYRCFEMFLMLRCDGSSGTGTQFPRNPHAEEVLDKLAAELVRLEYDNDADRF